MHCRLGCAEQDGETPLPTKSARKRSRMANKSSGDAETSGNITIKGFTEKSNSDLNHERVI